MKAISRKGTSLFRPRKHRPPIGARPGTLVIRPDAPTPRLRVMRFSPEELEERDVEDLDELEALRDAPGVTWIDVQGNGDEALLKRIGDEFHIHPLALEDVVNSPSRPKVDVYDETDVIVVRMLHEHNKGELILEQVGLIVGEGWVLSFQDEYGDVLDSVRERLRRGNALIRSMGADYLTYALLDAIVDAWYPRLEAFGDRLEDTEDRAMTNPNEAVLGQINDLRKDLASLRRVLWPMRDAIHRLSRGDEGDSYFTEQVRTYLRDVNDHLQQCTDIVESYREHANGLLNTYLSVVGNRTNEIMRVLTIVGSVFIPLTFLAGIYGMNFEHMPELKTKNGYFILLGIMGAVALGMFGFFWRLGWLGKRSAAGRASRSDERQ